MVDTINEANARSDTEFRAAVVRTEGLANVQVPTGAVVYMKVEMDQKEPGTPQCDEYL